MVVFLFGDVEVSVLEVDVVGVDGGGFVVAEAEVACEVEDGLVVVGSALCCFGNG